KGIANGEVNFDGPFPGVEEFGFDDSYHQFSYLDFSLRLADRVSDNVTLNAELRSLSGTQEDPWMASATSVFAGTGSSFYLRQANAEADLSSLKLILGRQHTRVAQGLLYDNDLIPTDQLQAIFSLGPVNLNAFIGSSNNNSSFGLGAGYLNIASPYYIGRSEEHT